MAILLNDNLDIAAIKPTDNRYGPFANSAVAVVSITPTRRYKGLTVGILNNGTIVKDYWFRDGIADTDLIVKNLFVDGTEIDNVKTYTKSLTLTTDWQDVGINNTDLATGTYVVQLYANDIGSGGTNNNEYYSGTMSWYSGDTDSALAMPTDEIVLHRAGASGEGALYLRTFRTPTLDTNNLKLQIYANYANVSASNYVLKFRRLL
jgi:hypothetical protein